MEGAAGSSRSPSLPGGVARGGGGSWHSRRTHLTESAEPCSGSDGCRDRQVGAGLGPGGRSRGCGQQGPGSRLEASGQPRKLGSAACGVEGAAAQDYPAQQGRLRGRGSARPGARRGAERTAPREGRSRRWEGGERGQLGGTRPGAETPGQKRPSSWGARTAPRAAGDSSLNPEHNFELAELGGADLSYFRLWLTRDPPLPAPRGPLCPGGESRPPGLQFRLPARVRGRREGGGQTEGGGQRNLTPGGGGEAKGTTCPRKRFGLHSPLPGAVGNSLFYALARLTLPPPPAKFEARLGLGVGAMCWGEGCSRWQTKRDAGRVGLRGGSRVASVPVPSRAGECKAPPICSSVGAGSLPPSILHCPFCTPSASPPFRGCGVGVRGHAPSLPPPLV